MINKVALVVIGALALYTQSAQAVEPPLIRALPAATRVTQLSANARAVIDELDGSARGEHLLAGLASSRTRADLQRFALEVQSVLHAEHGNYLYELYRALFDYHEASARAWANHLADMGVGIGITSGHFQSLDYLDPAAPIPAPSDPRVARAPMSQWVDNFVEANYRVGYRPFRRGSLSEILQLRYKDGTIVDIDIRVISDNRDPAPVQSMGRAFIGPGGRLFPLRLNSDTAPRLWRAKHEKALASMHRSNRDFENIATIGLAGVMTNIPFGLVVPVAPAPGALKPSVGARGKRKAPTGRVPPKEAQAPSPPGEVAAYSRIMRRLKRPGHAVRAPKAMKSTWPPSPPSGPKPGILEPNAASWRYQRYVHDAYRQGKQQSTVLPYSTWRKRHFEPALRGGRPGRPGSPAHQQDVARNNDPNRIKGEMIGNRFPDGVGKPGQTLVIRGRKIVPKGQGRVIVESDHLIRGGTIPESAARAQMRDIRKTNPGATLVVTDQANPNTAPLIYPPGKQPPPPGNLPKNQAPTADYP